MANGSAADAPGESRAPRDDSAFDLIDVPATVVCAACGDPDCVGCAVEEATNQSGVVAIIPWERPGVGVWRRLWQTSVLATLHARSFFGSIPDGDLSTAFAFALVCEALAVSGLALGFALIALICLPSLPSLLLEDEQIRGGVLRGLCFGTFVLVAAMVGLHAAHGVALDFAARRFGGRSSGRGLRFGLYACGWDLITLPLGLLTMALTSGVGEARRAAPLGLTAPLQAAEAYLTGHHGLSSDSARLAARRAAFFTALSLITALLVGGLSLALALR